MRDRKIKLYCMIVKMFVVCELNMLDIDSGGGGGCEWVDQVGLTDRIASQWVD